MLKYKIPFDKSIYIEQTILTLPYVYFKEQKKIKESAILAISFFLLGLVILLGGSDLSTLFFCIAIFVVFDLYVKHENFKTLKDAHIRNLKILLNENDIVSFGIFEFRDDCLRFSNDFYCTWIKWEDFKKYKVTKSNLLLIQKKNREDVLVIGKSEVNNTEFQKILSFVEKKMD